MTVNELKRQLHDTINSMNDEATLQEMLSFVIASCAIDRTSITPEEIAIIEERHQSYLRGESKLIPWEEVQGKLKEKYGLK